MFDGFFYNFNYTFLIKFSILLGIIYFLSIFFWFKNSKTLAIKKNSKTLSSVGSENPSDDENDWKTFFIKKANEKFITHAGSFTLVMFLIFGLVSSLFLAFEEKFAVDFLYDLNKIHITYLKNFHQQWEVLSYLKRDSFRTAIFLVEPYIHRISQIPQEEEISIQALTAFKRKILLEINANLNFHYAVLGETGIADFYTLKKLLALKESIINSADRYTLLGKLFDYEKDILKYDHSFRAYAKFIIREHTLVSKIGVLNGINLSNLLKYYPQVHDFNSSSVPFQNFEFIGEKAYLLQEASQWNSIREYQGNLNLIQVLEQKIMFAENYKQEAFELQGYLVIASCLLFPMAYILFNV